MEKSRIGYLGPKYSNSYEVAMYVGGSTSEPVPLEEKQLAQALSKGAVGRIVLPITNGSGGQVQWAMRTLRDHIVASITRAVVWRIVHRLIGRGRLDQVKVVHSHPQALLQCWEFLSRIGVTTQAAKSTSEAVEFVAGQDDPTIAAIGTDLAAQAYSVPLILGDNVADNKENETRFFVLGGEEPLPTGNDTTTILFRAPNESGALFDVLLPLKVYRGNMTAIESMPDATGRLGECLILIDADGNPKDTCLSRALPLMAASAESLRVLGSYPKATCAANVAARE